MPKVKRFCVYEHWRPDLNQCFYVGKGKRYRAQDKYNRSKWWRNICAKLERLGLQFEIKIIAEDLSHEEAAYLERERIAFYGRAALVNLTDGGEGKFGITVTPETREKLRRANIGKKTSEETKRKLSALNKGKPRTGKVVIPPESVATRFKPGMIPWNKGLKRLEKTEIAEHS